LIRIGNEILLMIAMLKRISITLAQQIKKRRLLKTVQANTTKIHTAVDSYGLPVEFEIVGRVVNGCYAVHDLIVSIRPTSISLQT
jgi:hypothetical protein